MGTQSVGGGVRVAERMNGFWFSQVIHTVAVLNLPDLVSLDAPGTSTSELARLSRSDTESLRRLMRAASSIGVFHPGTAEDHWEQTEDSRALRDDAQGDLKGRALALGLLAWQSWGSLPHSIRTGKPSFDRVHGESFFAHLQSDPAMAQIFGRTMTSFTRATAQAVARHRPLPHAKVIVDVGGGHGTMLEALLLANPGARGILFDTPDVVGAGAPGLRSTADRCELAGGDFFDEVPCGGDVLVLSWILHDWDDDECVQLLENCKRALPPDGEIMIIEMVVGANASLSTCFFDLEMLVQTGGRERTQAQHEALLRRAGLRLQEVIATPLPQSVLIAQTSS